MLYVQSKKGCFKKEYMRKIGAGREKKERFNLFVKDTFCE